MTNKEAKLILQNMEYDLSNQVGSKYCRKKYDAVRIAIKALEQEFILDKIRAEIMSRDGLEEALEIIDKYRK